MKRADRNWMVAISFTAALVLLIGFALTGVVNGFVAEMLVTVVGAGGTFSWLFPKSRYVMIAFANLTAVYAGIFIFFVEANFAQTDNAVLLVGFILPILGFLLAIARRRREIDTIVGTRHLRDAGNFGRVLWWLIPVFAIGALTFLTHDRDWGPLAYDAAFLAAMSAISAIVVLVSREVSIFLLDTGLLFEEFFRRMERLAVPAFAFFTFYSFLVIVFGAIYRILDHLAPVALFRVNGVEQKISFADSLYFSIVTLSTLGYGDIVPAVNLSRVVVALQIVCGILLLLFGFSEIIAYTRDRRDRGDDRSRD